MCEYIIINIICQFCVYKVVYFGVVFILFKVWGQGLMLLFEREQDMIGLFGVMSGVGWCNFDIVFIMDVGVLL